MRTPPLPQRMALVVPNVVKHDHDSLIGGELVDELVEEGHEGVFAFARAERVADGTAGVVERAEDHELLILACGRDPHCLSLASPDLCQIGMGVDLALVQVDQMGSCS